MDYTRAFFEDKLFYIFPNVYEPLEDSFLLAKHVKKLSKRTLDVGTGCGIQAITCRGEALGIDLNPEAVACAEFNARVNGKKNALFMESDLFERVEEVYDNIVFNPPYLPTAPEEETSGILDIAWNGGKNGRKVIDRFLKEFPEHLSGKGKLMMLHSSLADTQKTIKMLSKEFSVRVLEKQGMGGLEELSVLEAKAVD